MPQDRSSEADQPNLVTNADEIARIEAENTLRQFDQGMIELNKWIADAEYRLRVSTILKLNRVALDRLSAYAGTFRPGGITIRGSGHEPVSADHVPELMEEFCEYIHQEWNSKTAIHLAAYALWRLNWIHPFVDGNGRTARVVSYVILCARLGYRIPGRKTIPEQIAANKQPYYTALELADTAAVTDGLDVSALEQLIDSHLARQLVDVHDAATGQMPEERTARAIYPDRMENPEVNTASAFKPSLIARHIEKHPVIYTCLVALLVGILTIAFSR